MRRPPPCAWHDSADHDCNENTAEDEEETSIIKGRQNTVGEQNDTTTAPSHNQIADEDVPTLDYISVVNRGGLCMSVLPWRQNQGDI